MRTIKENLKKIIKEQVNNISIKNKLSNINKAFQNFERTNDSKYLTEARLLSKEIHEDLDVMLRNLIPFKEDDKVKVIGGEHKGFTGTITSIHSPRSYEKQIYTIYVHLDKPGRSNNIPFGQAENWSEVESSWLIDLKYLKKIK